MTVITKQHLLASTAAIGVVDLAHAPAARQRNGHGLEGNPRGFSIRVSNGTHERNDAYREIVRMRCIRERTKPHAHIGLGQLMLTIQQ